MRDQYLLAMDCLEIETKGGDVIGYLKSQGFISPKATWERLQINELGRRKNKNTGTVMNNKGGATNIVAKQRKITLEDKKKCVRIALDGGNPLDYLRKFGVRNPAGMWNRIKNNVRETDPKTWGKLPKRVGTKAPELEAE